jgi:hypothetical protein
MYDQAQEARRTLIHEVALALYKVEYVNKHQNEWDTLELEERMTDPAYIRGRFDAHQGTDRYTQFLVQATITINICIESAAVFVETNAKSFPHKPCAPPAFSVLPSDTGALHGFTSGQDALDLLSWSGDHAPDCLYAIASRLRALKTVL